MPGQLLGTGVAPGLGCCAEGADPGPWQGRRGSDVSGHGCSARSSGSERRSVSQTASVPDKLRG